MSIEVSDISKSELLAYAKDAGVQLATVVKFLRAGVPISEIDDILELRNSLISYNTDGTIHGQVSVDVVIRVYNRCGQDMTTLEEVFEIAQSLAGEYTSLSKPIRTKDYNRSLHDAFEQHLEDRGAEWNDADTDIVDDRLE